LKEFPDDVPFPKDAEGNCIPDHSASFVDSWGVLEELYASGKVRAIGVSNFSVKT
jgi:glycerol 2-dehydrogenase (NADP+)